MKQKFILSSLILLFFAVIAGGSIEGEDIGNFFIIIIVIVSVIVIGAILVSIAGSQNKKQRLEMIEEDEQNNKDIDRSISIGDDRCKIYFDAIQNKVMILRVMTKGIKKIYIEDFRYPGISLANYNAPYFNIYDPITRKLMTGSYNDLNIDFTVTDMSLLDKNEDVNINNTITPILLSHSTTKSAVSVEVSSSNIMILIDEAHGLIAITEAGKVREIFNYINANYLSQKYGNCSNIISKGIGNYKFIMDDFFKVLVIVTPKSHELFKYSDIIEVSYEENGDQLYTKSATRTVGGAVVGGMLMGGAGAVVGGLSGNSKLNMEIKNMDLKILLRNVSRSSCVLNFKVCDKILSTKSNADKHLYETYLEQVNQAKDVLAVIIDDVKQVSTSSVNSVTESKVRQLWVADELTKLAKLKSEGVLSDEEFQKQKMKLLNS